MLLYCKLIMKSLIATISYLLDSIGLFKKSTINCTSICSVFFFFFFLKLEPRSSLFVVYPSIRSNFGSGLPDNYSSSFICALLIRVLISLGVINKTLIGLVTVSNPIILILL
jgi:hypothetical protein